jgi:CBS domain-containing membrane protein
MAQVRSPFARLAPALAGANAHDTFIAGLGAILGVCLAGAMSSLASSGGAFSPLIVAPIGASAVLLFAVPSSPLAQPWSIVGGNVLSCLVGAAVGQAVGDPLLATGVAVGLAILAMSLTRCLHPPGGAVALMTVVATQQSHASNFFFALNPVGVNSALLVALGWIFHRFTRHSYPHVPAPAPEHLHGTQDEPPQLRGGFRAEDVDEVLAEWHETFDIDRDDLERLLRQVELRVFQRVQGPLACSDIMSKDVVSIPLDATTGAARDLMRARRLRRLPVIDRFGVLAGVVTAADLIGDDEYVSAVASPALVANADWPVLSFVSQLTDGRAHEVVVVDDSRRVIGLLTQTDLLVALARQAAGG